MNIFTIQLLILLFPGILGVIFINYILDRNKELRLSEGIAYSFALGVSSYLLLYLCGGKEIYSIFSGDISNFPIGSIIGTTLVAIFLSGIIIIIIQKELLNYFLRKIGIANTFGIRYILKAIYMTPDPSLKHLSNHWVCIRYHNRELNYVGYIQSVDFIENSYIEILLSEVNVTYNNQDKPSYSLESLYLCEKPENIVVEFLPNL